MYTHQVENIFRSLGYYPIFCVTMIIVYMILYCLQTPFKSIIAFDHHTTRCKHNLHLADEGTGLNRLILQGHIAYQ